MSHTKATDYSVRLVMNDGSYQEIDEWFSLNVAKKIAAKAYDARVSVTNSPVVAIEVVDFNGEVIQSANFN